MNNIILFADNKIFTEGKENRLFHCLRKDSDFSVLPIDNLSCLESTVKSASTFQACIVDWDFKNDNEEDADFIGVQAPQRTPMSILMQNPLYTLLYIYSERGIPDAERAELESKYEDKVQFRVKQEDVDAEYRAIKADIRDFESRNAHMVVPFCWSQAINQSAQKIFSELESANSFWIKEIRDTSKSDGGDPTSEIIDMFNNLLNEDLIQNGNLRELLDGFNSSDNNSEEKTARLYQRIYYSKLNANAPIMTGDIFRFNDEEFGILITPECEISKRVEAQKDLDFLLFKISDINEYLKKTNSFERIQNAFKELTKESRKDHLRKIFNNDDLSTHILPSFPAQEGIYNQLIVINFKTAFKTKLHDEYRNNRTSFKLNAPYIHQLRQRYISFFGRFGVPAIPSSLRDYNLNA